ncbi:MAG: PBP1A family penicillin-binding protein [Anaerolineae bacterium]|nr:PBP1A family penicillin-binding protein [Candidatus Roseilinea sp.]MDW8451466.1 PBP1A family penicillin-binding protein [Anaerolineae bacterium]
MNDQRDYEHAPKRAVRNTPPSQRAGYVPAGEPGVASQPEFRPAAPPIASASDGATRGTQRAATPQAKSQSLGAWLARIFFAFALVTFVLSFATVILGLTGYLLIVRDIPDPGQLAAAQSTFASTKIFDREGNLVVELTDPTDPTAGRRTRVPLSQISPYLIQATLATEDPNFYRYAQGVGFDPIAIVRALYYAITEREFVSGGSTITQQVARNLLLSPAERSARTLQRKIREIVLANELTRRYTRDQILEIYLNENYYGNQAYGVEAAAQLYFGKPARALNLAEASMLAGIPQSPVLWDPVTNKQGVLRRQNDVLRLMAKAGYITPDQIYEAQREIESRTFTATLPNISTIAPHFMQFVKQQLDAEYGAKGLYRDGLRVYTSLDPRMQVIAENAIRQQIAQLRDKNVTNGAAVVIEPKTGEILAMVGSADFNDPAIDGQVNVAIMLRQPGSAVKPFTYLAALERGRTPATLYWDRPVTFTNEYGQVYAPRNYDGKFHGPMLMREALARSMNIPAVETLDFVTVPGFLEMAQRVGLNFPPNPAYGLAITLGGAEARLLDLTAAYAVLANGGVRLPPIAITRVESADGRLLRDYRQTQGQQVVRPEHAWLITSMLSDNAARAKTFGLNSPLRLSRPAAAKTGTTNDFRDNLTVGYTPDLVVGVWVGNSDNSPMRGVSGITGAAPIWKQIMEEALAGKPATDFTPPPGVVAVEICEYGGHVPSPNCPRRRIEYFSADQLPLPPDENVERAVQAGDPDLLNNPQPPIANPQSPDILITSPSLGEPVARGLLSIRGTVNPPGFQQYVVEYGEGENPGEWKWISGPHLAPVVDGQLTAWGIEGLPAGRYTIRVTVNTANGPLVGYARFDVEP